MKWTYSLDELDLLSKELITKLPSQGLVMVNGEMGAGKTTLIAALLKQWGCSFQGSPTFALMNSYVLNDGRILNHYDLYRIDDPAELWEMGFQDMLEEADLHFIEWSEKGSGFWNPSDALEWNISVLSNGRSLSWEGF
jgi:tRNA threonylcarbamoyladenosine biosynthesis protein TsaE